MNGRIGTLILLVAIFLSSISRAEFYSPPDPDGKNKITMTTWLVGKLVSKAIPGYYGSAVLYDATDSQLFFITAAHLLPLDTQLWSSLRYVGTPSPNQPTEITVVGYSRGYDIAVFSVPRPASFPAVYTSALLRTYFYSGLIAAPFARAAMIGLFNFVDVTQPVTIQGSVWADEAQLRQAAGKGPEDAPLLSSPTPIFAQPQCPQLFLTSCYRVPFRSWGFSGGVLAVESLDQAIRSLIPIGGFGAYYTPLAETTYFVPSAVGLRIADRLRREAGQFGLGYHEIVDETGTFQYLGENKVQILKGKLVGAVVSRSSNLQQPGGEPRGGGGSSALDGWSTDSKGDVTLMVGYPDFLRAMQQPEKWGAADNHFVSDISTSMAYKGTDTLVSYSPGVRIEGSGMSGHYFRVNGKPITTLQSFLLEYGGAGVLNTDRTFIAGVPPSVLVSTAMPDAGIHTEGIFRLENSRLLNYAAGAAGLYLAGNARVEISGNSVQIRFQQLQTGEKETLLVPSGWKQEGDYFFRAVGRFSFGEGAAARPRYGVVTLEYNTEKGLYELKALLAAEALASELESDPSIQAQGVRVDGLYLPLVSPP